MLHLLLLFFKNGFWKNVKTKKWKKCVLQLKLHGLQKYKILQ